MADNRLIEQFCEEKNEMRVFLVVMDSVGVGNSPDAEKFGDEGSNTLKSCYLTGKLNVPNLKKLGLFNIDGVDYCEKEVNPIGAFARLIEKSNGKDTTVGHWEIAGLISERPFPTYPNGFPKEVIEKFEKATNRKVLCNKPYSGTEVIKDFGEEHMRSGALIVYTSADSVFQIAAHEEVISPKELYAYCNKARKILVGENAVARVIARPFVGDSKNGYKRTANRKDLSLKPPKTTMLDCISKKGKDVIGVGKIGDIFGGRGLTASIKTKSDGNGMQVFEELLDTQFDGLCFINLVDFDAVYGHRNDVSGYTENLNSFDEKLGTVLKKLSPNDVLMITADHGCDPATPSTDHSRECVPLLIYGQNVNAVNLGTRVGFCDIAKTTCEILGVKNRLSGKSFYSEIAK